MSKTDLPLDERRKRSIEAVATFTSFMHAHERGELERAADARAELKRLGVSVHIDAAPGRSTEDNEND